MYKFTQIDDDNWKLEYKDKEYIIKRNIALLTQLQSVDFEARVLLNKKLKDLGCTLEDVEYEKEENGKKTINDSEVQKLLDICKKEAQYIKLKNIVKDILNEEIENIALELGEKEFQNFITQLMLAISGKIDDKKPSEK